MEVNYLNTGSVTKPHYKNDISVRLIQQLLNLLEFKPDAFTISEKNGLICVYIQHQVVLVKSLQEFYNSLINFEIRSLSTNTVKQIKVLRSTLLLFSGKKREYTALKDSILFLKLFFIPLMTSFNSDKMVEMILQSTNVILPEHENAGFYNLRTNTQLSGSCLIDLVRSLSMVKDQMDISVVKLNIDKRELEFLFNNLHVLMYHMQRFFNQLRSKIKHLRTTEPIKTVREALDVDPSMCVELGRKFDQYVKLYATTALIRNAMLHYMSSIVSVNNTQALQTIREGLTDMIDESLSQDTEVLEFVECCKPQNVISMSMIQVDENLKWILEVCSLKMKELSLENEVPVILTLYDLSTKPEYHPDETGSQKVLWLTNHLLGEIEWTDITQKFSGFHFEKVPFQDDINIFRIRLEYRRKLYLTVLCYDDIHSRIACQSADMFNDTDGLWKVIPLFLGDMKQPGNNDMVPNDMDDNGADGKVDYMDDMYATDDVLPYSMHVVHGNDVMVTHDTDDMVTKDGNGMIAHDNYGVITHNTDDMVANHVTDGMIAYGTDGMVAHDIKDKKAHGSNGIIPPLINDSGIVALSPVAYPHTTLYVRNTRYGQCLSLWTGDPGPKGYWRIMKPDIKTETYRNTGSFTKRSCLNIGQLKIKCSSLLE